MGGDANHFQTDYVGARRQFLAAAEARRAVCASRPLAIRSRSGDELAIDCAYLGPDSPARLLAVSSGVHGVEGFAGSALQHQLLTRQLDGLDLPADTGLLLVHAVNPYGFAELRRVNESNVDLNRNFVRHPDEHAENPGYEALLDVINPEHLDEVTDARSRETLLAWATQHGFPELQSALTRGQYRHPGGVQFGGVQEEQSNRLLREIVAVESRGAQRIAWVDVHTGLGPYGVPELITELPPEDPAYQRGRSWYGDAARSTVAGESVSAAVQGPMERGLSESLEPGRELTAFAAEFGTYDPVRVFWAMRADNWLEQRGQLESAHGRTVKRELLEVFRPDDAAWRELVLRNGAEILRKTRDGLVAT
jgi:hypothetical protein